MQFIFDPAPLDGELVEMLGVVFVDGISIAMPSDHIRG